MPKLSEVRTQIYLPREQHRSLQRVARARETSMAQVVRDALEAYLDDPGDRREGVDESVRDDPIWTLTERARDFGDDGSARRHDEILYGPTGS